jgi:heterodisulfide reductase subunit A
MTNKAQGDPIEKPSEHVGVYICHCGGNISDHLDVELLRQRAEKVPGVALARTNVFMCSDPGQELMAEDLKKGLVDRVVVASCAPSLHEKTFRQTLLRAGVNPYLYEHANIREQVSWVHHGRPATDKATRLVAAAVGKARTLKPLIPLRVEAVQRAVVIGGGVAGLRSAKDLAERGFEVVLIEKSPFLGGRTALLDRLAPTGEKAVDLVSALSRSVLKNPAVRILTCCQVIGFQGYIGNFQLRLQTAPPALKEDLEKIEDLRASGSSREDCLPFVGVYPQDPPERQEEIALEAGVIVLATGFQPYRPRRGEFGYGEFPQVVTLPEFIQRLGSPPLPGKVLEFEGRKIRSLALIHCVGSRQIPGLHEEDENGELNEYCSRTCCSAVLQAANLVRENYPGTAVYDFYRDIRTYGRGQEELYERASSNRVVFLRFNPDQAPTITAGEGDRPYALRVRVQDTLTFGEEVEVPVDLAVLAVGMKPEPLPELVEMMKLPVGNDRFLLEVHPKLRPVELSLAGILLAGTCQAPMDVGETANAAGAAAVKASALLSRGWIEMDPFVAEVDPQRCQGTGACLKACLNEGALRLVAIESENGLVRRAEVSPALCKGCGACVAVCPEGAINLQGWTLRQYADMVDMIVADDLVVGGGNG